MLEIVNSSVGFVYSVGSYLSIECMYRSRTKYKINYKIQNKITKYKIKLQDTKYLSIECMHRSRKCNKFKITNERAMEMIYLVRKN